MVIMKERGTDNKAVSMNYCVRVPIAVGELCNKLHLVQSFSINLVDNSNMKKGGRKKRGILALLRLYFRIFCQGEG